MNKQPETDPLGETIGPQSRVRLHYAITLEDGTVADATIGEKPVEIELGSGMLHPNLERLLIGRRAGDSDVIVVPAERGFGVHDPALVQSLSLYSFPPEMAVSPGSIIGFTTPGGSELPGTVLEIQDQSVMIDFNHPFAGQTLTIGLEVIAIENPAP